MSVGTAIKTALGTAAATLSAPACTQVLAGEPDTVNLPTIAYMFMGIGTWEANTLNVTQELSRWHIRVYLPMGPQYSPAAGDSEDWMSLAIGAIRGQLEGAVALSGEATGGGLILGDATTGWMPVGGQWIRVADMDLDVMMSAVHPIAH